jgi:hypothetical protein
MQFEPRFSRMNQNFQCHNRLKHKLLTTLQPLARLMGWTFPVRPMKDEHLNKNIIS